MNLHIPLLYDLKHFKQVALVPKKPSRSRVLRPCRSSSLSLNSILMLIVSSLVNFRTQASIILFRSWALSGVYRRSNSNVLRFVAKEILDAEPISKSSKRFNFVCIFLQNCMMVGNSTKCSDHWMGKGSRALVRNNRDILAGLDNYIFD